MGSVANRRASGLWFWGGVAVYSISFFLPAIDRARGWECAIQSLQAPALPGALADPFGILVLLAGLTNPAIAIYVAVRLLGGGEKARLRSAVAALAFVLSSCVFVTLAWFGDRGSIVTFQPRVGYFLWVCAVLLMVGGDLLAAIGRRERIGY